MIVRYHEQFNGISEREFTQEVHGDNFEELAREFAHTNKGVIIHEEVAQPLEVSEEVSTEALKKNKGGRPKKLINSES